jgi:hypothetical protein
MHARVNTTGVAPDQLGERDTGKVFYDVLLESD